MDNAKTFPCLAGIFCDVAACCTLYRLFDRSEDGALLGPRLLPWLLFCFAIYAANRFFLRKARSIPAVIALNALLLGSQLAVLLIRCSVLREFAAYLMAGGMILFTGARACMRCFTPPTAMHSIRQLEAGVAILLIAVWFQSLVTLDPLVSLPPAAAVAVSFSALIAQRLEGARGAASGSRTSGFVTVGLVLLALAIVMLLFMLFFSAPVGEGVLWLWRTGAAGVRWLFGLLGRLMLWFASLFPDPEPGEPFMEPFVFSMPEQAELAEENPLAAAILMALTAAGAAVLCVWMLWKLRKFQVGGVARRKTSRQSVSRTRFRFLSLLSRALRALGDRLRRLFRQFRGRNTPAGVCVAIERRGRLLGAGRGSGETHCAYLRRISGLVGGQDAGLLTALESLADTLERGFYAGGPMPALPGQKARELRGRTSRALRRRLLPGADAFSRIKSRFLPTRAGR